MIPFDRLDCQCPRCKPIGGEAPREILVYSPDGERHDPTRLWSVILRDVPTEEWPRA